MRLPTGKDADRRILALYRRIVLKIPIKELK